MPSPTTPSAARSTSPLAVRRATADDRPLLERLWLLFRHDLSGLTGTLPRADGTFRSERLDSALADRGWAAFVGFMGEAPVGFAFVRNLDRSPRVLNSFFVVAGARRAGVGSALVDEVLRTVPGHWEIAFQGHNTPAVRFWRRTAARHDPDWGEELRPVPGDPHAAPDAWVTFHVPAPHH